MKLIDRLHLEHPFMGARMLRNLKIERLNQVWALDITYIPMAKWFVYLTAVVDWFSRKVMAVKVAITLDPVMLWKSCRRRSTAMACRRS